MVILFQIKNNFPRFSSHSSSLEFSLTDKRSYVNLFFSLCVYLFLFSFLENLIFSLSLKYQKVIIYMCAGVFSCHAQPLGVICQKAHHVLALGCFFLFSLFPYIYFWEFCFMCSFVDQSSMPFSFSLIFSVCLFTLLSVIPLTVVH